MFIRVVNKKNGPTGKAFQQFSLVQASRVNGKVKQRNIMYLGSEQALSDLETRAIILEGLKSLIFGRPSLFPLDPLSDAARLVDSYYAKYVDMYGTDPVDHPVSIPSAPDKADYHTVDLAKLKFEDVKSFGAEHLCKQVILKLELDQCFESFNWGKDMIDKSLIAICARAIFCSSEHRTAQYLNDNSEMADLFGINQKITHKHLYSVADKLYDKREAIDKFLFNRITSMFGLDDKLVIFDISNTYFESRKQDSKIAKFGRSKEKRKDCKIVVFSGVINAEGFIRHSEIYEGNMPDVATLEDMINNLEKHSPTNVQKTIVIDAGIASDDNLAMINQKGYKYVAVAKAKLKDYELSEDKLTKIKLKHKSSQKQEDQLEIAFVNQEKYSDTWMYVQSPQKALKEASMDEKLTSRYLQALDSLNEGLQKPGTIKLIEKIWERVGRLKELHKRASPRYDVKVNHDKGKATCVSYTKVSSTQIEDKLSGVYFIRTNHQHKSESQIWDIYNTIREVESTFRCLKSDLNLRPIHHQLDHRIKSHIYLAILAYQLVNTIRYLLKAKEIKYSWTNILRIMSTHIIHTSVIHTKTQMMHLRKPTEPTKNVKEIYQACNCDSSTKPKRKFVVYH
jgi:hypothetical protein